MSTVHNWVHRADLQHERGGSSDHVAVDETVFRLEDEQYRLYVAVDPEAGEPVHTKLEPTGTTALAHAFFTEARENHDVDDVPRTARQFSWALKTHSVWRTLCSSSTMRHR